MYIPSYLPTLFFAGLKILKKEEKNYVIQQQIKILTHFGLAFFLICKLFLYLNINVYIYMPDETLYNNIYIKQKHGGQTIWYFM